MQIICPICGQPFERQGRQKRCVTCTNDRYWEKYNQKYGGVSLEESQSETRTTHSGLELSNNCLGKFMDLGDVTDKELYYNSVENKKEKNKKYNQKQRDKRNVAKLASQIAPELAETPFPASNEDEADERIYLN